MIKTIAIVAVIMFGSFDVYSQIKGNTTFRMEMEIDDLALFEKGEFNGYSLTLSEEPYEISSDLLSWEIGRKKYEFKYFTVSEDVVMFTDVPLDDVKEETDLTMFGGMLIDHSMYEDYLMILVGKRKKNGKISFKAWLTKDEGELMETVKKLTD